MNSSNYVSEFYDAFKRRKFSKLRKIHSVIVNEYIKNPSKTLFNLSLISYVLSKVLSKPRFMEDSNIRIIKSIEEKLKNLCSLNPENKRFFELLQSIEKDIFELEGRDPRFIFDLFTKARIKLAAKLYAKGISLGKVSSITKIPKEEILSYAGKTLMFDKVRDEKTMEERVELLRRMLE